MMDGSSFRLNKWVAGATGGRRNRWRSAAQVAVAGSALVRKMNAALRLEADKRRGLLEAEQRRVLGVFVSDLCVCRV